ncbi:hypothetical protein KNJ79_04980 [Sphingopyxis indica]|uniref:hypothetical protein n=1 Tax=Sphingopyxis indica TaxID=436663 RepID=UPI002938E6DF|nr:hypothetical protein [Sphingopyxis indica]WOF44285.1 hypothetical protein KNJ79_04980 [Sphingopyxis indica]
MPTFEVQGPDPDGDYWVVRVEMKGAVENRTSLIETYSTAERAQAAADRFNADPDSAPTDIT